jgi:GNAT superfamily N-acetyltransferase
MMHAGYEINLYQPALMHQVVDLLHYHWGNNHDNNLSYFKWKYVDNPFTDSPLGIVALHKGEVVGFRGYFATRWQIREKDYKITVLCPGDTCVHPDHRMKGLSVTMGNMAMKEYESKYKIFLNLSAWKNSVPGYLKMGFVPLSDKTYLTRLTNPLGMLFPVKLVSLLDRTHLKSLYRLIKKYLLESKTKSELCEKKITFGEFYNIVVADSPRAEEMYSVISKQDCDGRKISLLQDERFFRWRFNNKRNKYVFYYSRKNNITTGYIVMRISKNNRFGYIVDYAENDSAALKNILQYIIKAKHFDILLIFNCSLSDSILQILKGLRFKKKSLLQIGKKIVKGVWPLLVRPVKKKYFEGDWFIEGLDVRKIENWEIKEICSDGA